MAVVASRSSLVGALLRSADPASRLLVLSFLEGLSCDELNCLAEFQGAFVLESMASTPSPYRMLPEFFDPNTNQRWHSPEDRAHKTFVVLAWLEHTQPMRQPARQAAPLLS